MTIQLDRDDRAYVPGEPITGTVKWDLDPGSERIIVRLLWQTSGKGTQDTGLAHELQWDMVPLSGEREFEFPGVEGPYSFSGKLITVGWLVEAIAEPGDAFAEQSFSVSPTGAEVTL